MKKLVAWRWTWNGSKKNIRLSLEELRELVDPNDEICLSRQCELLGIARSSWYHSPCPESDLNLELMMKIDQQYMKTPFYGSPRMTLHLNDIGYQVNRKRIVRLMRKMCLKSVMPGPHTSKPSPENKIYPYLLRQLEIDRPNQVWCSDITYIPMANGFMYLVAVMDWHSRYVLSHQLSNTMDASFCVMALEKAFSQGVPEIFNTDQGAQFTSVDFTRTLLDKDIKISMDGKGRAIDNVFIERLWRTLKYEHVYPMRYENVRLLQKGLEEYFEWYNNERKHSSLDNETPYGIFKQRQEPFIQSLSSINAL